MTTAPLLLSVSRCAEQLGVSHSTIRRLMKRGVLPVVRIGHRVMVHVDSIDALLRQAPVPDTDAPDSPKS